MGTWQQEPPSADPEERPRTGSRASGAAGPLGAQRRREGDRGKWRRNDGVLSSCEDTANPETKELHEPQAKRAEGHSGAGGHGDRGEPPPVPHEGSRAQDSRASPRPRQPVRVSVTDRGLQRPSISSVSGAMATSKPRQRRFLPGKARPPSAACTGHRPRSPGHGPSVPPDAGERVTVPLSSEELCPNQSDVLIFTTNLPAQPSCPRASRLLRAFLYTRPGLCQGGTR